MRACLAVQVLLAALIPQSMAQSESGLPCKLRRIHASPSCNYACFNSVFSQSRLAYIYLELYVDVVIHEWFVTSTIKKIITNSD